MTVIVISHMLNVMETRHSVKYVTILKMLIALRNNQIVKKPVILHMQNAMELLQNVKFVIIKLIQIVHKNKLIV